MSDDDIALTQLLMRQLSTPAGPSTAACLAASHISASELLTLSPTSIMIYNNCFLCDVYISERVLNNNALLKSLVLLHG